MCAVNFGSATLKSTSKPPAHSFLDYIYSGEFSSPSVDLLFEMLELAGYWGIQDLFEDVQSEIVRRRLIRPDTLEQSQLDDRYQMFTSR